MKLISQKTSVFYILTAVILNGCMGNNNQDQPVGVFCQDKLSDFNYQYGQVWETGNDPDGSWGPLVNHLQTDPNLKGCALDSNWQRQRVLVATDYWIKKKLNYCHHHSVKWFPNDPNYRTAAACPFQVNEDPRSPTHGQQIRWNYSGIGEESLNAWMNKYQWYGVDCSDFTAWIYNFGLGQYFTSKVDWQAGQSDTQAYLTPNGQRNNALLNYPEAAGSLVCNDGTVEDKVTRCDYHGGYISSFDSANLYGEHNLNLNNLEKLLPGDLIFIGNSIDANNNPVHGTHVVHVVIWTGKKIGYGVSDIPPEQIAPNSLCKDNWGPNLGDWVIVDSHYQGPDYRDFTPCFYQEHFWGVRRIIK